MAGEEISSLAYCCDLSLMFLVMCCGYITCTDTVESVVALHISDEAKRDLGKNEGLAHLSAANLI